MDIYSRHQKRTCVPYRRVRKALMQYKLRRQSLSSRDPVSAAGASSVFSTSSLDVASRVYSALQKHLHILSQQAREVQFQNEDTRRRVPATAPPSIFQESSRELQIEVCLLSFLGVQLSRCILFFFSSKKLKI